MAIQYADGFDIYGAVVANLSPNWINDGGGATLNFSAVTKRTGGYSLHLGESASLRKVIPNPQASIGVACAYYFPSLPTSLASPTQLINFRNAANAQQCFVYLLPTGAIRVNRGGTLLGTSLPVITPGVFHHIEVFLFCNTATGNIEIRVNGFPVLVIINANTANDPSDTTIAQFSMIVPPFAFGSVDMYIDDLVIWDVTGGINNGFLGDRRCLTLFPSADSAPLDWTATGGGAHYTQINEVTPDDSNYVSASAVAMKDTYTLPDLPANAADIAGLVLSARISKDDASDCALRVNFITGIVEVQTPDLHPVIGFQNRTQVFDKNPITNVHFTPAEFNAGFLQLERTI